MPTGRGPQRVLALGLAAAISGAVAASAEDAERSRLAEERAAIEARYVERERECRQRFIVTSCVDDARRERRQGLDALRTRQLQLDEDRRRARTAERNAELAAKAAEDARREQARPPRAASSPSPGRAPRETSPQAENATGAPLQSGRARAGGDRPTPKAAAPKKPPPPPESAAERREREERSRASYELRQRQAAEHRREVAEKEAKRRKESGPAAPLPVPPPASAATR